MDRIIIDPAVGDAIVQLLERQVGHECHIVLIALPADGENLGEPSFVSSLMPEDMEALLIHIAAFLQTKPTLILDGVYEEKPN